MPLFGHPAPVDHGLGGDDQVYHTFKAREWFAEGGIERGGSIEDLLRGFCPPHTSPGTLGPHQHHVHQDETALHTCLMFPI